MNRSVLLLGLTALLAACADPQPPEPTYTCPTGATVTAISAVQGSGAASPLNGQTVTVRGVVTLDAQPGLSGFYLQDVAPDTDAKTSEGLFVFTDKTPRAVKAGEVVQLTGTVKEFGGLTELDTVTSLTSCGLTALPTAATLTYPLESLDVLETVEGMRVTVTTPMTVTNTFTLGRFGELGLSSGGRLFNPTNGQGGSLEENRRRTLVLDDLSSRQNPATIPYLTSTDAGTATRRAGDTVIGLTGALHFANGNYKLQPSRAPVFQNTNPRPAAPKAVGGTLKVAGANVLNYFTTLDERGADTPAEFERQKAKVVAELRGLDADVITLMEVENNGETALDNLVEALNTAAGKAEFAPVRTGTVGTDAIRVAIIYRPDRVDPIGAAQIDTADVYSRPPVAQTFQEKSGGGVFTVVANHFKSKGSCPTAGDVDQGQGCWNLLRVEQSRALLAFADKLKVTDPDVLLMGDLNAYGEEDPIDTLEAGGFESLNKRIPLADRYSYQFDGQFGYLDHTLASAGLGGQVTGITEWHINADEPVILDYNTEFKATPDCKSGNPPGSACTSPDLYAPTPYRSSDHDPVLVGLKLTQDATPQIPLSVTAQGEDNVTAGQPYTLNVTSAGTPDSVTVTWGDGTSDTLAADASSATHTYAAAGTFTVTVTAKLGEATATATKTVTVQADAPQPTGGVFFSEYIEGSRNNKAIEIYNGTAQAIPANALTVNLYSNGATAATNPYTVPTELAAGATYVIANAGADPAILAKSQATSTVTFYNGDDALELVLNGVRVDVIGQIGFDPGTVWGSGDTATLDRTLRRKASVTAGDADGGDAFDPAAQWDGFATDTSGGLGSR